MGKRQSAPTLTEAGQAPSGGGSGRAARSGRAASGARCVVVAEALPRCERLAVLDMREIPMSLEVADELAAGLPIWRSNIRPPYG